jgi:tRNA(Ile)-lysidine synthetase-like protein
VVIFEDSPLPLIAEVMATEPHTAAAPDPAAVAAADHSDPAAASDPSASAARGGRFILCFDYDALAAAARTLRLRPWRPGGRIALPGMDGTKKLQDVFVDAKIPRAERETMLLLATESEILWIPALRHTRLYAPAPGTARMLTLIPGDG